MKSLSTGDVAKLTRCSIQLVIRWIDSGELKAWKVPGSRFRRVEVADLRQFMLKHEVPMDLLDRPPRDILLISEDPALKQASENLTVCGRRVVCESRFEAGRRFRELDPCVVVIDWSLGSSQALALVDTVGKLNSKATNIAVESPYGGQPPPICSLPRSELGTQLAVVAGPALDRS